MAKLTESIEQKNPLERVLNNGSPRPDRISRRTLDLYLKKFDRLVVTGFERIFYGSKKDRSQYACVCLCDCGGQTVVVSSDLIKKHVRSCGCLWKESMSKVGKKNIKNGQSLFGELVGGRTSTYRAWKKIRAGCKLGIEKGFHLVCHEYDKRWDDYSEFLSDFGEIGFFETISRKDRDIPWCKENCFVNRGGNQSNRILKEEIAAMNIA